MTITDIIFSTQNPSKVEQIKVLLDDLPIRILTPDDVGIEGEAVEDGNTLSINALKKAVFVSKQIDTWIIAEDTGLFIDALDGRPGIYAARWAGEDATTEDILRFTLEKMKDVPLERRTAHFETAAVVITPDKKIRYFTGSVYGTILTEPRVPCQPNMPYSGIFVPIGQLKVWAEMSVEEENKISHRGKAFRRVYSFIESNLK